MGWGGGWEAGAYSNVETINGSGIVTELSNHIADWLIH